MASIHKTGVIRFWKHEAKDTPHLVVNCGTEGDHPTCVALNQTAFYLGWSNGAVGAYEWVGVEEQVRAHGDEGTNVKVSPNWNFRIFGEEALYLDAYGDTLIACSTENITLIDLAPESPAFWAITPPFAADSGVDIQIARVTEWDGERYLSVAGHDRHCQRMNVLWTPWSGRVPRECRWRTPEELYSTNVKGIKPTWSESGQDQTLSRVTRVRAVTYDGNVVVETDPQTSSSPYGNLWAQEFPEGKSSAIPKSSRSNLGCQASSAPPVFVAIACSPEQQAQGRYVRVFPLEALFGRHPEPSGVPVTDEKISHAKNCRAAYIWYCMSAEGLIKRIHTKANRGEMFKQFDRHGNLWGSIYAAAQANSGAS